MKRILLCLAIFLSGCATTATGPDFTPAPTPAPGQGLLYLMRSPLVGGEENAVAFAVDGQDVVQLQSKGYSWLHLPAGTHHVKTEHRSLLHGASGKMNIVVDVKPGAQYFVERLDEMVKYPQYLSQLKVSDPAAANDTIKAYKYTPAIAAPTAPSAPAEPQADASKATVYLYRSARQSAHIDMDIILTMDGKKVCSMEDRHYTVVYLEPGDHDIKAAWDPWKKPFFASAYEDKALRITVASGKKYHVNFQISGRDGTLFEAALVQESEPQAQQNLSLATHQRDCHR